MRVVTDNIGFLLGGLLVTLELTAIGFVGALLLGLSLVAAACGGDDDDDTSDSAPAETEAAGTTGGTEATEATTAGTEATETTAGGTEGTAATETTAGEPGEPGALEGMVGTTPLPPELTQEFRDRLATMPSALAAVGTTFAPARYFEVLDPAVRAPVPVRFDVPAPSLGKPAATSQPRDERPLP